MNEEAGNIVSENTDQNCLPGSIVNRRSEWSQITSIIQQPGSGHIHIHGPRGNGKTLLAQRTVEASPESTIACYIPCTIYSTQYQVLRKLFQEFANEQIPEGHHTSQLQRELSKKLENQETVIILDELDFLIMNDAEDLLYFLTRNLKDSLCLVTISANFPDLSSVLESRTYSTLQPHQVEFEPYSKNLAARILSKKARYALQTIKISDGVFDSITEDSTNIRFCLHWLASALKHCENELTVGTLESAKSTGLRNYWETLLSDFSVHHRHLLEIINELSTNEHRLSSGQIYDYYNSTTEIEKSDRLSTRRISDFLKHLELLGIIQADYHYGGKEGKTREIQLKHV